MQCCLQEPHEYVRSLVHMSGGGRVPGTDHRPYSGCTDQMYSGDTRRKEGFIPGPLTILLFGQSNLCGEHGCREGTGKGPRGWHWLEKARLNTAHPEARPCGSREETQADFRQMS